MGLKVHPQIQGLNLGNIWERVDLVYPLPRSKTANQESRWVELMDLLGKIFFSSEQIVLGERLWVQDARIALPVKALAAGHPDREFVLILGANDFSHREREGYDRICHYQGEHTTNAHSNLYETTHLGGNLYYLPGVKGLENLVPLHRHLYSLSLSELKPVIKGFLAHTLPVQTRMMANEDMGSIYIEQLGLPSLDRLSSILETIINNIIPKLRVLQVNISRKDGWMQVQFEGQEEARYPDPQWVVSRGLPLTLTSQATASLKLSNINSLLSNPNGKSWLTDFLDAGMLPLLWMPTELESTIRYDWTKEWMDLDHLYFHSRMEQLLEKSFYIAGAEEQSCLLEAASYKGKLPEHLCQIAHAVWLVRDWARQSIEGRMIEYKSAMFYQAIRRLLDFDLDRIFSQKELAHFGHLILSLAVLSQDLVTELPGDILENEQTRRIFFYDKDKKQYLYQEKVLSLTKTQKRLFDYIYMHPDHLFSFADLIRNVLYDDEELSRGINFDRLTSRDSEMQTLHQLITRLRKKLMDQEIEFDQYFENKHGQGYYFQNPLMNQE